MNEPVTPASAREALDELEGLAGLLGTRPVRVLADYIDEQEERARLDLRVIEELDEELSYGGSE